MMHGYVQRPNQRVLPRYQEPSPPYQASRNFQHNPQQAQFNPQHYSTQQARHSNGQHNVVNHWSGHQAVRSDNADFQQYDSRYDGNQSFPQQPVTRYQVHYRSSNMAAHNADGQESDNRFYGQLNSQSCSFLASHQNYRTSTTGTLVTHASSTQVHAQWTQYSDQGNSRTMSNVNTRGWSSHFSDNGRSCQQPQPRRDHIYPQHPQQLSGQRSGQQQTVPTPGRTLQYNHTSQNTNTVQRMINVQSRMAVGSNSVTLPHAGPHRNNSPPSSNVQQSQPEPMSNGNLNVLSAQSQNNPSRHPNADANVKTCNVNQNAQRAPTQSEAQLNPTSKPFSLHYYLQPIAILCSRIQEQGLNKKSTNQQRSDGRPQNTCPDPSNVSSVNGASNNHNFHSQQLLSEPNLQSAAEPPHKQMNFGQTQRGYWKLPSKNTNVSEDSGLQSTLPGARQMAVPEPNCPGQQQSEIQYVTDPDICLEAVFALRKQIPQLRKAVAIVPPISQQPPNTEKIDDGCTKSDDNPPLKVDAVCSIAKESDSQTEKNDKLSQDTSPAVQENDRISPEKEDSSDIAKSCVMEHSDTSCDNPSARCQNDISQSDCNSSDVAFSLSNVPVDQYTLGNLTDLVNSFERTESSAQCPENICNHLLDLYWNGDFESLKKDFGELYKEGQKFDVESVKDYKSVVFESITLENFKKLSHCEIVTDELCSSFEEYKSSWLNVDGQPADINKVLSEPLSDYITVSKEVPENICVRPDNLGVNSLKDFEVTTVNVNEHAKPDSKSPGRVFTPSAGNVRTDTENKGHSDAEMSGVMSLCSVPGEQETFGKQVDNMQNHKHLNTIPSTDLTPSEVLSVDITSKENLSQEHVKDNITIDQKESVSVNLVHENLSVSDLQPVNPGDEPLPLVNAGSDDNVNALTTKPSSNFTDTWQVEDISEDEISDKMDIVTNSADTLQVEDVSENENSDRMDVPTNCTGTMQVEDISEDENVDKMDTQTNSADMLRAKDISEDENLDSMEVFTNSIATFQVEDISEDENSDSMEVFTNSIATFQVEDISEDDNSDNMEVVPNSTDILLVEDISNDENSTNDDDSLLMDVTVMSAEEALSFFQQLEKECQSDVKMTSDVTKELFCSPCWDMAPSLDLELDPCSPKSNDTDLDAESENLEDCCSPPSVEILEPVIASTDAHIALTEQPKVDTVDNSVPEIESTVERELAEIQPDETKDENSERLSISESERNETDVLDSPSESEKLEDSPPSLEVLEPVIASTAVHIADEKPKDDTVVNLVPEKKPEIQSNVEQVAKIRSDENPEKIKSVKIKIPKRKPSMARFNSDDPVLFTPDIVIKKIHPQKTKHSHLKAVSAGNSAKNETKASPERQESHTVTLQSRKEKVKEKAPKHHKTLHRSNTTPEMNLSEKKMTTEKKKVKFALFGSKNEQQRAIQGRRFLPPTTLTMSDACQDSKNIQCSPPGRRLSAPPTFTMSTCNDYSDVISAKQKVHIQWSSTFIPKAKKKSPPRSPPKGEPPKKKPLKAHELLKSNMPALKNQMMQRTIILFSQNGTKFI